MGFRVKRKAYKLVFQGTEFDGLEATVRSLTTGQLLQLEAARLARAAGGTGSEGATREMVEFLADALVEWNAENEDDGTPIPATLDGLLSQDLDVAMAIIAAWQQAMNGVAAPLSETSSGGEPSLEASIPMDAPSPSPTS
ncbi:hypothetical protein ABH930_000334 [Kitasatospora sp. GAS204A]|uniref:hypothetical protein n=1 Tax=unclassified Kitasatospora TaxID=2633591 RepID=UPI0024740BB7|nr:hypothetical protein [Kitasatospora sp. GAS204B]MDH6116915.1 hypothetical protein [Kitasatospora sp. GAS204B]